MADGDNINKLTLGTTVAMLDSNQGIGYKGDLPWPRIKEDYEHYMGIVTETSDPKKKNGIILGRITWNEFLKNKGCKIHPKLTHVIVSSSEIQHVELCRTVKPTYDEAVEELFKAVKQGDIEKIFVLGGSQNYAMAVEDPRLKTINVTRIFNDFPVDCYFPEFRHNYHKVSNGDASLGRFTDYSTSSLKEDNGIKYQFEVWDRNSTSNLS